MSQYRCEDGRRMRHDPMPDDPYLETDCGRCPDCAGEGCTPLPERPVPADARPDQRHTAHMDSDIATIRADAENPGTKCPRLTKEQAAIIGAFTGIACGPFSDLHGYAERVLGRPIWTHQFANKALMAELKEAARDDFIALCNE